MPTSPGDRAKRALLIGVNQYPNLDPRYALDGCVNDVTLIQSVLEETFGFPPQNVRTLTNEGADRDGILAALETLIADTGPEDIVVLHYSGHGSQRRDKEGDEPDGWDETIMPSDSGRGAKPNRDITDDEIYHFLKRLGEKTRFVTLIFDCCHSGTITRDAFGVKSRWVERDERPVDELPDSAAPVDLFGGATRGETPSGWLPLADSYVLVAGCRDEESSYEHHATQGDTVVPHGSLTYHLCQALVTAEPGTTYRDVFERVSAKVTAANGNQHPQMEGKLDREVLGVRDIAPMRYVRVTKREGDRVTLAAGAAHGMTVGSVWAVHPPGAKGPGDDASRLGTVEITAVQAVEAEARVKDEASPGAVVELSRAVEETHAYGDMRLKVQVVAAESRTADRSAMASALGASHLLEVVDPGRPADARVYLVEPREGPTAAEPNPQPVPQLGRVATPVWAAVTQTGELMMPPKPPEGVDEVKDNLEKLARYRHSLALENPDATSRLRGKVTVELLAQRTDGSWVEAAPEEDSGSVVFRDGDHVAVRVTNHHSEPVYIYLLDFGLTGAVSPVYPMFGANEALEPGRSVDIGIRDGQALFELGMPDGFPFGDNPYAEPPRQGVETFKLFATTREADFGFLAQAAVRSVGPRSEESPLEMLLRTATRGAATRDIKIAAPIAREDWVTVDKPFVLKAQ